MMGALLPSLAEAWLPAFILAAGLTLGALMTLAIGHLLRESWLAPLRPPLAAMALGAPILLPLATPLLVAMPMLYPRDTGWFETNLFLLRSLMVLLLWAALGRVLARETARRRTAGIALLALTLSGAIAMDDWAVSRDPAWISSLQGLSLLVGHLSSAMALAVLLTLHRITPDDEVRTGVERAMLSLGLAILWMWFTQFVVVYAADLPEEAAWYVRRSSGAWPWLKLGIALPALLAAIALAIVPQWRFWRLVAVSVLLLLQHVAHVIWVVRPDATVCCDGTAALADALIGLLVAACMVVAWRHAARRMPA
jgi:hypothetical protein